MNDINNDKIVWVNNIGRAAAMSIKHEIVQTRMGYNKKFSKDELVFGFIRSLELVSDLDAYDNGSYTVDALTYYRTISDLKAQRWQASNTK